MEELEPERATTQSTAIYEDKDGRRGLAVVNMKDDIDKCKLH